MFAIRRSEFLYTANLSRTQRYRKLCCLNFKDPGEIYRWIREENIPGYFPYTAGVFPLKRKGEDPTRMFAGEGDPDRTNRRFKLLSGAMKQNGFRQRSIQQHCTDTIRIYGRTYTEKSARPGSAYASWTTFKVLYGGFDLCSPSTSVSMTINGPAPVVLAMFLNAAIDQQMEN